MESIFRALVVGITQPIQYQTDLRRIIDLLRKDMEDLISMERDLKRRVDELTIQGFVPLDKVQVWLMRADVIQHEVERLDLHRGERRMHWTNFGFVAASRFILAGKVIRKRNEIQALRNSGTFEIVATKPALEAVEEIDEEPCIGAEQTLDNILSRLHEDDTKIIGIYGMGGVGKTALMKKINNYFLRNHKFEIAIWVTVSQVVNEESIQREIVGRLRLPLSGHENLETRARKLAKSLRKKKYLLLLDDLWGRLDLSKIGVPYPKSEERSKIVFTTRSLDVCSHMGALAIKVEPLDMNDAWDLFQEHCRDAHHYAPIVPLEEVIRYSSITPLVKDVASRCSGLPLALISVARAVATRKTQEEWEDVITILNKSSTELSGMKEYVLPVLLRSYDSLANDSLKSCFVYCSLFPEDYDIEKEVLIECWISEGLIYEVDIVDEAYNRGQSLIYSLINACLLERSEKGEDYVKMHTIVRMMAIWIALESGKWMVRAGFGLTGVSKQVIEKCKELERISLMQNKIESLPEQLECPNLLTLMLERNENLTVIPERFFEHMNALRVLNLTQTKITMLPSSISLLQNLRVLIIRKTEELKLCSLVQLKQLEVLDLLDAGIQQLPDDIWELTNLRRLELQCNPITELSEGISRLVNLRRLGLASTEIKLLPKGIGQLVDLRYLNLSSMNYLLSIPYGVFSMLTHLKDLRLMHCQVNWVGGCINESESNFSTFECLKNLITLTITISNAPDLCAFLQSELLVRSTRQLEIKGCNGLTHIPQLPLRLMNLTHLEIRECNNLETVMTRMDMEEFPFPVLGELILSHLPNLNRIVEREVSYDLFRGLHKIIISNCEKLRNLESLQNFQNLQVLVIENCPKMEMVFESYTQHEIEIEMEGGFGNSFLRLTVLEIHSMPELQSIDGLLLEPCSFEQLTVSRCPKLKKLPRGIRRAKAIRCIKGERQWWEGLEWDDDDDKQALQPYFIETNYEDS